MTEAAKREGQVWLRVTFALAAPLVTNKITDKLLEVPKPVDPSSAAIDPYNDLDLPDLPASSKPLPAVGHPRNFRGFFGRPAALYKTE